MSHEKKKVVVKFVSEQLKKMYKSYLTKMKTLPWEYDYIF